MSHNITQGQKVLVQIALRHVQNAKDAVDEIQLIGGQGYEAQKEGIESINNHLCYANMGLKNLVGEDDEKSWKQLELPLC